MHLNFDVIIGGAGISGLLIASELSKTNKVLVIEAQSKSFLSKYWVTMESCAKTNSELAHLVDTKFHEMEFSDAYRNTYYLKGGYVLWKGDELIDFLKQEIIKNNGEIKYNHSFCGYNNKRDYLNIFANEFSFSTKLFIDCMGYKSPLILSKNLIRFRGYYALYGAKLDLLKPIRPICLSNIVLNNSPKYFEVFPTSGNQAYATMIYPTQTAPNLNELQTEFKYVISKSIYSHYFNQKNVISKLWGIVPVGTIKRTAMDNMFFFGESAQSNPAATGTCLTRLLDNYKKIAAFLNESLKSNCLSENDLSKAPLVLNSFTRNLQLYSFQEILSWNSDKYSKFIKLINQVDHGLINKFLFGELNYGDVFQRKYLIEIIKRRDLSLFKLLVKAIK